MLFKNLNLKKAPQLLALIMTLMIGVGAGANSVWAVDPSSPPQVTNDQAAKAAERAEAEARTKAANEAAAKANAMASEINAAREKIKNTENEIANIKNSASATNNRLRNLELENEQLQQEKKILADQIDQAELTMLLRQTEYIEASQRALDKYEQYQKRIATMFYFKQRSPIEILLQSKGLDGFFSNIRMIRAIAVADANMVTELRYAETIKEAAADLAYKTKAEYDAFMEEKLAEIAKLEEGISIAKQESTNLYSMLQNRTMELADVQKDLQQKEAAYSAYRKALATYSGKISQLNSSGLLPVWPLPIGHQIFSGYGYRTLGFDAANGYVHTGVDLGSPNCAGAPVVAAWDGIVATVNCPNPGAMYAPVANYIQLSHGGGLGTGYWHLLNVAVTPGQYVTQGQVIGYCGSTGQSTGPHLHFEVYDENNPNRGIRNTVDPMQYLVQ